MQRKLLALLGIFFIFSGCTAAQPGDTTVSVKPGDTNMKTLGVLSYSLGDLKDVNVNITFAKVSDLWTAQSLLDQAKECSTEQPFKYYEELLQIYAGAPISVYHFVPKNSPDEEYKLTVMANVSGYTALENFKKDFDVCAAGGMYPSQVSKGSLLFTGSCGGAAPDKKPEISCGDIEKAVSSTAKLVD